MRKILLSVMLLWSCNCLGKTIHVPGDSATIQAGIDGAQYGDTVLVAEGTYTENILFVEKSILLLSAEGRDVTFIEPDDPSFDIVLFAFVDTMAVIDGFTIRNTTDAYGIRCSIADPIIRNCDVSFCNQHSSAYGAGILCKSSGAKIRNNRIHHNSGADVGGGIAAYGNHTEVLEITRNEIYSNSGSNGPGIGCTPGARNTLIARNLLWDNEGTGSFPGAIYTSGQDFTILNNTVVGNTKGIIVYDGSGIDVRNNIICYNTNEGLVPGSATFDYNNVWNNGTADDPGPSGISADPNFADPASHNYALEYPSPCIDAGDPDPQYNDADGTRSDIGALPYLQSMPLATSINYGPDWEDNTVGTLTPEVFWSYTDTLPTTQAQFELQVGTDADWTVAEMWSPGPVSTADTSVVYAGNALADRTLYFLRLRVNDGTNWGGWRGSTFYTRLFAATVNVPADFATIQAAIDQIRTGDTVLVAPGTYTENIDFDGKGIYLLSSGGREVTFVEAYIQNIPIVSFVGGEDRTAIIDGFTIRNVSQSHGILCNQSDPTIRNCEIASCSYSGDGAGICCINSGARIHDNKIHGNDSDDIGGGIYATGTTSRTLEILRNEVFENFGRDAGSGIGCYNVENVLVAYNTIWENTGFGDQAGGIYLYGFNSLIHNNAVVGNTHGIKIIDGAGVEVRNNIAAMNVGYGITPSDATADYNDMWLNGFLEQPEPNGIVADPLFTDTASHDYTLQLSSPCIDAGDPSLQYVEADGSRNDMGAYPILHLTLPVAAAINAGISADGYFLSTTTPEFFWSYFDSLPTAQAQFELEAGTDDNWNVAELWSTGQVSSSDTSIVYGGSPLTNLDECFIRIRVNDGANWGSWNFAYFIVRMAPATIDVPGWLPGIQYAMDRALDDDTILVAPGTYVDNVNFRGKRVLLQSTAGRDSTLIEPAYGHYPVVNFSKGEGPECVIDGFTIRNTTDAHGIECSGTSPTIRNCDISFCYYDGHGCAVYCVNSGAKIISNRIHDNEVSNVGAGIYVTGYVEGEVLEIVGNDIYNNAAAHGEGIWGERDANYVVISRNVIRDNDGWAEYNGGISIAGSYFSIVNNTIVNNGAGIRVRGSTGAGADIRNNIVASNIDIGIFRNKATSDFNDAWNNGSYNQAGRYGISEDPLFVDPASGDYSLQSGSPCIDAGDPSLQYLDADGSPNDMGALPLLSETLPAAAAINFGPDADYWHYIYTTTPEIFWSYYDSLPTTQTEYEVEVGTDEDWAVAEMWATGPISSSDTTVIYSGSPLDDGSKYYLRIRVNNGIAWGSWRPGWFFIRTVPITIRVPSTVPSIQEALDWAFDDDTILVADGTYIGSDNHDLDFHGKSVLLVSENGSEATIIYCSGSITRESRGFVFTNSEDSTTVVQGFTLRNGYGYQGGTVYCLGASPTFIDCVFDSSTASTFGGAVYCDNSSPTFTGCVFKRNESIYNGGAIYCTSSSFLRLTDCTLSGNRSGSESPVISGSGAGIYCAGSSLQISGCSFTGNRAMNGSAGLWCEESSLFLHGCLFTDNGSYFEADFPQEYPLGGGLGLESCLSSTIDSCLFASNFCEQNGGAIGCSNSEGNISSCTFARNFCDSSGSAIGGLGGGSALVVENSIIASNPGTEAVGLVGDITLVCCDVFGNGGNWVGGIAGQQDINGNFSENPIFCGVPTGNFTLEESSPCLPSGNSCGVLVGVFGLGCTYICGDVDDSGDIDVDDAVYIVAYIFTGNPPIPLEAGDVDCSDDIDIDDAVYLIQYIFAAGNAPCDLDGDGTPDC